ncbi:Na+ dependent nucleoside transporter C-terminus-domain-containing protein [Lasiosphaeris hirsuta]|uniref:Na+ dependent nucleoside transporter C-terminus-domain-containing protein n=1 Tax=Lasiosphaeris hirsuta TaxID=260670 RepID=A0AA40AZ29_9PEZI|nr:Na+ dependent nucleoside transporter C-terminus-domain-containing protein [Lasiosphaeris hirsuta]
MESKHDDKETNVITSTQAPQYNLDPEKQSSRVGSIQEGDDRQPRTWRQQLRGLTFGNVWRKIRVFRYIFLWLLFTTWLIYGIVYHRDDYGWLVPTLFYIGLCMRLFFNWVPSRLAMIPIRWVWQHTAFKVYEAIPSKLHQPLAALVTLAVFLIGSFVPEETGDNTRAKRAVSIFGLLVMILLLAVTSRDFKRIPWHTVIGGMLTQYIIAVFVLRTQAGYDIFSFISGLARTLLGFATDGLVFLTTEEVRNIHWFLVSVVPAIIFFIALVQLLYHIGLLQWTIVKFATFFFWTLRVSGAEAVVAAATPFIGQGESAMLIRPFISRLTLAELHQIMTCGFATIAGSVLVAYIGLGLNPQALVSSCIMSIPASLAVSKLRYPETEETMTSGKVEIPEDEDEGRTVNALHAFSNGAWLGIKIGATIIASLLCVIALVALVDGFLGWWGKYYDVPQLSLTYLLGYILWVPSWLLGVSDRDVHNVARLIGMKIIANEYVAFNSLKTMEPYISMTPRSQLIATYACCGFGNVSSLGIQIGILSQLAPKRAGDVVKVAVSALFSGVLATLTSASVAGMLFVHAS